MRRHQRFSRRDHNHAAIVRVLHKCGVTTFDCSHIGDGFPDLACKFRDQLFLLEIKNPMQSKSAQKLTPAEQAFHAAWLGAPVYTVSTIDEVVALLNRIE
jgi:hypothetical protein